ncbi:hypothetical protein ACFONN_07085 [Dyella humi]|uniref:Guanylate cyclase domain-containing protein n=1 Tax=Dyella humi TaxID=1770547 RepID=A0ABW8II38_9GAMM
MKTLQKRDYFDGDNPVHKTSYCAFLDVLGFSERISASFKDGCGDELLQKFHAILQNRIDSLKNDSNESLLYFKSFTDNVILAHPRFSDDMESEFGFILWSLSEYQFEMAKHGFFIRGGLSVGDLFVDENSVYGPALIEAYSLESKIAVNPVVVLSDDAMGLVLHHCGYYAGNSSPQEKDVLVGSDGRFFINYLMESIDDSDFPVVNWDDLFVHKSQIELALKEYQSSPSVFAKYAWLAAYHNYFCDSISYYNGYSTSVKISDDLSSVKFGKISDVIKIMKSQKKNETTTK